MKTFSSVERMMGHGLKDFAPRLFSRWRFHDDEPEVVHHKRWAPLSYEIRHAEQTDKKRRNI
ncbi:hypothetical protein [Paracidobacterium acidisoli]|uniref:Uncharacterized protein n=1 Tax=Paracidobacterium acidisoli TaxID=2303751 RepID=A0A372IQA8_9BACT|nr:hypothetical protein [Paracidobacterium acidisoli]MBT9331500.1 hypothetical protein [Paracidobacterium acidisoli]